MIDKCYIGFVKKFVWEGECLDPDLKDISDFYPLTLTEKGSSQCS